jgi:cytochrome c-type biogenesis protein CcmH/NrfF
LRSYLRLHFVRLRFAPPRFVFLTMLLFAVLSPELNVSRETFAEEAPTSAQVSQALTCQCGCGLTVANCNMPTCGFAVPVRTEIDRMIGKGMRAPQIVAFYRHKFGEKVLSAPTTEGFNLLAWTMPFIALFVGGGVIALAFGRWRAVAPVTTSEAVAAPSSFDPALRRRLEKDLKESS